MNPVCSAAASIRKTLVGRVLKVATVVGSIVLTFAVLPAAGAQASSGADTSLALINSARSDAGLASLAKQSGLDSVAQAQAARMVQKDAIYHNPNLKSDADAAGVNWQLIGENVGVGADVEAVHDAFMASPGHRDNVLYSAYNAVGIGVAVGSDGSIFVAQAFAQISSSAPVAQPAPSAVAPAVTAPAPVRGDVATAGTPAPAPVVEKPVVAKPVVEKPLSPLPNAVIGGVITTMFTPGA